MAFFAHHELDIERPFQSTIRLYSGGLMTMDEVECLDPELRIVAVKSRFLSFLRVALAMMQ